MCQERFVQKTLLSWCSGSAREPGLNVGCCRCVWTCPPRTARRWPGRSARMCPSTAASRSAGTSTGAKSASRWRSGEEKEDVSSKYSENLRFYEIIIVRIFFFLVPEIFRMLEKLLRHKCILQHHQNNKKEKFYIVLFSRLKLTFNCVKVCFRLLCINIF